GHPCGRPLVAFPQDGVARGPKLSHDCDELRPSFVVEHGFAIERQSLLLELDHPRREHESRRSESHEKARVVPRTLRSRPEDEIEMSLERRQRSWPKAPAAFERFDRPVHPRHRMDLRI